MMSSELEAALPPISTVGQHSVNYGHPPSARYSKLSEKIRQSAPGDFQCSLFCGGKNCKYETINSWSKEDMAINGIYSHWITNDILAMARPNTENIEKYNIIQQFNDLGIKSIINLQQPGEHASCGNPLERSCFSYNPQVFMDNGVFFYNFRWKDYGTVSENTLLDMVKVMAFAMTEGRVAVHCHAGLGRTGVLIACYLVYSLRCKPNDAIRYIRIKRPCTIQTRNQISCVQQFAQFIIPLFTVFTNVIPKCPPFTLNHMLARQRRLLHGLETRHLKHIPKIIYIICERLLVLANCSRLSHGIPVTFDVSNANSFCNFFLSATQAHESPWRPASSLTMQLDLESPTTPETATTSLDGTQDFEPPRGRAGPPSRGAAYYMGSCESRCDQSSDSDYSYTPDFRAPQGAGPGPGSLSSGRSSGSLSAERGMGDDNCIEDEYMDEYNDDDVDDELPNSDESIDSMLMDDPTGHLLSDNTCYQELANRMEMMTPITGANSECRENILAEDSVAVSDVVKALLSDHVTQGNFASAIKQYQKQLNNRASAWDKLDRETDLELLTGLLWSWLDNLKEPVLNKQDLTYIVLRSEKPVNALISLDRGTRYTTEYLVRFMARLFPTSTKSLNSVLRRLIASLTHQSLGIQGVLRPAGSKWSKIREGTLSRVMMFIRGLYDVVAGNMTDTEDGNANSSCGRVGGRAYLGINLMASAIGRSGGP